jgi:predicted PurR-regulated permease PerM
MGTFIMAFVGNSFVESTQNWRALEVLGAPPRRRRALVVCYFLFIVALITVFGVLTIPDIVREGADFVQRLQSDNIWVVLVEKIRSGCG